MYDRTVQEMYCELYGDEHKEVRCDDCQRQMACPYQKGQPCLLRSRGRFCRWFVSRRWPLTPAGHELFIDQQFHVYLEETEAFSAYQRGERGPLTAAELLGVLGKRIYEI